MYGTIARMHVKPGAGPELISMSQEWETDIPGFAFSHVFKMDADPNDYMVVIVFHSKEAYHANAASAEQEVRTKRYTALIDAPPEWHDGEMLI